MARCEVASLEADASAIHRVRCEWNGRQLSIPARVVVLAAGALMTPILLLGSTSDAWPEGLANRSGLVGRNLMLHASDFLAIRPDQGGSSSWGQGPRMMTFRGNSSAFSILFLSACSRARRSDSDVIEK
jgi:choline dehydrogenase-like flavoprotein